MYNKGEAGFDGHSVGLVSIGQPSGMGLNPLRDYSCFLVQQL